jgi:hypothetical protein
MRRNGLEAVAYMAGLAKKGARGVNNRCLQTVRIAWGLPSEDPSAIAEWNSIPINRRRYDPLKAPIGAPHFWKGGKYGHVAMQAEHEGFVWTTDLPDKDRVGLVASPYINKRWKYQYLGWSLELQNAKLPLGPEAPPA